MTDCLLVGFHIGRETPPDLPSSVAQYLFESALFSNWSSETDRVTPLTVSLDPYFPRARLLSQPPRNSLGTTTVNLPIIRECLLAVSASHRFISWRWNHRNGVVVLCFHYLPLSATLLLLCAVTRTPTVVIFTDLPLFSYSSERVAAMPKWKRPLMQHYRRGAEWLATRYNGYVLFTKAMDPVVNPGARPSIVVEGIYNDDGVRPPRSEKLAGVIAHAGTLDRAYGIATLLDAFSTITDRGARLWLFGSGDMDEEIAKRATDDPRITHFGFLPREELLDKLSQAAVLVILRDPSAEFTLYSFPSKLFEYLATGSVVATTPLAGIPPEYYDFVKTIEFGSPESIGRQLGAILNADPEALRLHGERGRRFVTSQKTPRAQTERIRRFATLFTNYRDYAK